MKKATKKTPKAKKQADDLKFLTTLRISLASLKSNRRNLLKYFTLYFALYLVFVRALSEVNILDLNENLDLLFGDSIGELGSNVLLTGTILGLSLSLNDVSSIYASILFVIFSLVYIWMLRHQYSNNRTTLKEALYEGMYPLIPYLLVISVMLLEMLPLSITSAITGIAYAQNLPTSIGEHIFFGLLLIAGFVLSGYFLIRSIIALYIVTVPRTQPIEALKTAKQILKGRRMSALMHSLSFALLSLIAFFGLLLISVVINPEFAIFAVIILGIAAVPWTHSFFYAYYRQLLDE